MGTNWYLLLLTALVSWLGTGAVLHYASALGVVNAPTERDSHSKLIPDGGGLGFALAGSVIGALGCLGGKISCSNTGSSTTLSSGRAG